MQEDRLEMLAAVLEWGHLALIRDAKRGMPDGQGILRVCRV